MNKSIQTTTQASIPAKTDGKMKGKNGLQKQFTDKMRKKEEAEKHTLGGF